jgi:HPt (histidine-containing phosphotransfer) domain-containing protein
MWFANMSPKRHPPWSRCSTRCIRSWSSKNRKLWKATSEPQSVAAGKGTAAVAPGASPTSTAVEAPQLHDELDEQLLPLFLEEALDLNQNIATQLHAWRSNPADGEAVRRLARLFHTLKGSARMAGAMNLGELTHAIETRMQEAQEASQCAAAN